MNDARPLTGRKVLTIVVSAFGVIIAVNLVMAYWAVSTFPGLEVRNSYIASQGFNERLAEQRALGWQVAAEIEGGTLTVVFTDVSGAPVPVADFRATLERPTHARDDQAPAFVRDGNRFTAPVALGVGNWNLRIVATSIDGREFTQRLPLNVTG